MKILQVTAPDAFEVRDVPIPEPGPGEVRMKVDAVTTCPQWDLHLRHNEPMFVGHRFTYPYAPGQPGHEATGVIDAIGEGVIDLVEGDHVSAWRDWYHTEPGCYAQYAIRKAENVIKVPLGMPVEALAPIELSMCVGSTFRMLRDMHAIDGKRFAVTGLGPAGLIALQMAKAEGAAEVVGFDLVAARREHAAAIADACFDPASDLSERFPARPEQPTIDVGVDCVGAARSVGFLMDHVIDKVALFGVQREDYPYGVRHHSLTLCGYPGHNRESAEYAVDLIRAGKLDLSLLVTHKFPLERYGEAIDLLERQEAIKVCFLPWQDA